MTRQVIRWPTNCARSSTRYSGDLADGDEAADMVDLAFQAARVVAGDLGLDQHAFAQVVPVAHVGRRVGQPQIVEAVVGVEPLHDHFQRRPAWAAAAKLRNGRQPCSRPPSSTNTSSRRTATTRPVCRDSGSKPLRRHRTSPPPASGASNEASLKGLGQVRRPASCGNVSYAAGPGRGQADSPAVVRSTIRAVPANGGCRFPPRRGNWLSATGATGATSAGVAVDVGRRLACRGRRCAVGAGRGSSGFAGRSSQRGSNRVDAGRDRPPDRAASRSISGAACHGFGRLLVTTLARPWLRRPWLAVGGSWLGRWARWLGSMPVNACPLDARMRCARRSGHSPAKWTFNSNQLFRPIPRASPARSNRGILIAVFDRIPLPVS